MEQVAVLAEAAEAAKGKWTFNEHIKGSQLDSQPPTWISDAIDLIDTGRRT